jgi:uroporphyrinogen decarboxylase
VEHLIASGKRQKMTSPLLELPAPDFAKLEQVLKGEKEPRRVHLVELHIDHEVLQTINERYLSEPWIGWDRPSGAPPTEPYLRQLITLYYRLGYDCVPTLPVWVHHPSRRWQKTEDTAELSRGEREWASEGRGLISSREEFELFPWDKIRPDLSPCEFVAQNLPEGMKMTVMATLFEHVLETLLGYEGLFFMLYDEPDLVAQVFARWGQKVYDYYQSVIGLEGVGAIFHADDLGFKTSTLLSPDALRQHVFPWLKKYAALAHEHGKMFWYHCCGNVYKTGVIEDLIEDVRIDAFHSFQDVILSVTDFKARYGDRVAALGGVDMDKLARLDEASLREHIRAILERCMPGGRFALASGNSIANYIPLQNYCIMLEESRRWQPPGRCR